MAVAAVSGRLAEAATHAPSLMAFIAGVLASQLSGQALKRGGLNSRSIRLGVESGMLAALALFADRMPNRAVTACVGFIAGVQINSLSRIGSWSFNTGMTTGNLRSGARALAKASTGAQDEWPHGHYVLALLGLRRRSSVRRMADPPASRKDAPAGRRVAGRRYPRRATGTGPDSRVQRIEMRVVIRYLAIVSIFGKRRANGSNGRRSAFVR
jgi:Protein of unknown function (DUF1275)